jgi:nitrogen fixation negative regulator NifL
MTRRLYRFALISTAALVAVTVVLALLLRWVAVRELQEQSLDSHLALVRTLSASHSALIRPLLESEAALSNEALAASAEVQRLDDVLVVPLQGMKVVRIKIYSPAGRVVYSTEPGQIGEQAPDNHSVLAAREGHSDSEIIHRETFNTSDGVIEHRDLVESYVPIQLDPSGPLVGVFELYSDITPLLGRIDRTQTSITIGVLAVLGCFYVLALILFRRTDRDLQQEHAIAGRYLAELEQARLGLEERVAERTREVAESEQRFRDVADAAGEYIWEVDQAGRFTYLSDRVKAVLGYTPEELIGRTPTDFMPDEDAARVRALFSEPEAQGTFVNHEHRSYAKSGDLVWLSVSGVPMHDADGRVIGHRGANFDITTRKHAERQVLMLSHALEQSVESILICDRDGRIEYVNASFTRNSGYSAEEAIGQTPAILKSGETGAEVYAELWRTISVGHTWNGELYNRAKDGTHYWDDVTISPVRDGQGKLSHYLATQINISERKRRQMALRDSEERLRAIMESTVEGIITIDGEGTIEMCNPAAEALFGYAPGELIGRNVETLAPEPHRSRHRGYIERYLRTGEARIVGVGAREMEGQHKSGSVLPIDLSVSEMLQGGSRKFVGVVRDLTARKRAEEELENTRQRYFHREKIAAIGQLAAGIIHEVGNPVAAIHGAVESMRMSLIDDVKPGPDRAVSGEVRELLDTLAQQVSRLTDITREVSEVATPRVSEWQWLDLNEIVRGAVRLLRYDPRLDGIALDLDLDSQLPAVFGSPDQLTQVIFNLLVNAEDACEGLGKGKGVIRVETRPGEAGVRMYVCDNGFGMDDPALARAFEAYFTTKDSGDGLGLGLSLCRSIVAEHGGTCSIASSPAKGTTVTVDLPLNVPVDLRAGAQ